MFNDPLFMKFFAAMFAIANPFTNLPIFLSLTQHMADKRFRVASVMAICLLVIFVSVSFFGEKFLTILGITLYGFEIAGGIIVLLLALSMLHAKKSSIHNQTKEEGEENKNKDNPAIVPLGVPLIGGPGAITTIIIYTSKLHHNSENLTTIYAVLFLTIFLLWFVFCFATPISKFLGQTGMNIITRIMAIILAAIGVDMLVQGIKMAFNLS